MFFRKGMDTMAECDVQRNLTAILVIDVVGYSRLMGHNPEGTLVTLTEYREVFSSKIQEYKGRVVNESIIGNLKEDNRMHRNHCVWVTGDSINTPLRAAGFKLGNLLAVFLRWIWGGVMPFDLQAFRSIEKNQALPRPEKGFFRNDPMGRTPGKGQGEEGDQREYFRRSGRRPAPVLRRKGRETGQISTFAACSNSTGLSAPSAPVPAGLPFCEFFPPALFSAVWPGTV